MCIKAPHWENYDILKNKTRIKEIGNSNKLIQFYNR